MFFVFGGPIVAHILSSHYESYNLHIAELTNENGQVVWKASYVTIMIFMWLDWPPESPDNQYHLNK
uniref:Membrane-associated sensor domain-containing protein n=1 Tax=uncultured Gemmatimonadales bacterium HF0770_11C06 TaxID=723616 RepID=E7C700_9BACT|nr:hypothetical protein [uncultured Gemmatimonadales bacterium HF0770_11C06]